MQENGPVLLVLSVCDGEIILEKGENLSEKRHSRDRFIASLLAIETLRGRDESVPTGYPYSLLNGIIASCGWSNV